MSVSDAKEFERLVTGLAHGELSPAETAQLRRLAAADARREVQVHQTEKLLGLLGREREVYQQAAAPLDPSEDADPVVQQLRRRAAEMELRLRREAVPSGPAARGIASPGRPAASRWDRFGWRASAAAMAAALLAAVLWWATGTSGDDVAGPVDPRELGGPAVQIILLDQVVSRDSPEISWQAVPGARSYRATIVDPSDAIVLQRAAALARGTRWALQEAELERLRAAPSPLRLRVVALDSGELEVATTGDRTLSVR
ncbi:MAG: hypothetical protein AAF628_30990 [Planctomycetota bacterium]